MEPFIGQILAVGFGFAPRGWAFCDGQLLPIAENTALFSLIGTTYGGDGRTNFALPDLRGRAPIGMGRGLGLTPRDLGERSGAEIVNLVEQQMPTHTHSVTNSFKGKEEANADDPSGNFIAGTGDPIFGSTSDISLNPASVETTLGNAGGSQPHNNMSPYLGMNYIICLNGLFPSRN